jgi:hypothetical protein
MKKEWNTDQDIKTYFENRHIVPSDHVWAQLSKEMHKNPAARYPQKSWYRAVAAIWIFVMVSGAFIYQYKYTSLDNGQSANTPEHQPDRGNNISASTEATPSDVVITPDGIVAPSKSKTFSITKAATSQGSVIRPEAAVKIVMHTDLLIEHIALAEQKPEIAEVRDIKDTSKDKVRSNEKISDKGQVFNAEKAGIVTSKAKQKTGINPLVLLAEAEAADNAGFIAKTFRSLQDKTETLIASVNERNVSK